MLEILQNIYDSIARGDMKNATAFTTKALEDGVSAEEILEKGMLPSMDMIGEKFKNNEIYIPEVLLAARAMNKALLILRPRLMAAGIEPIGRAVIGTVKGDSHDIGKNLVKLMLESKGIEVFDLGADVSKERFYEAFIEHKADIVACSALLTTSMPEMPALIDYFVEKYAREDVIIMVGGAPITEDFAKSIGADLYHDDAASAAVLALKALKNKKSA